LLSVQGLSGQEEIPYQDRKISKQEKIPYQGRKRYLIKTGRDTLSERDTLSRQEEISAYADNKILYILILFTKLHQLNSTIQQINKQ